MSLIRGVIVTTSGGGGSSSLANRVIVTQATDLSGTLDSTKEYFIDGVVDMGSQSIEVPVGGLNLTGYNFEISRLISTADNYTMFISPVGGSGNVIGLDYDVSASGANSKVYDLKAATGLEAFEFVRVNYTDCTSLGVIDNYRQGLESGTGRFGGLPELTLSGNWLGGYLLDTSIVRNLDDGAYSLFKAGAGFVMNSRFRTNANVDLPASASLLDFSDSNFPTPSTLQLDGMILTRNGVVDSDDPNVTPNITAANLSCDWEDNVGVSNTFVGGELDVITEVTTTISTAGVFVDLLGTYQAQDLQHFDSPSNGQLRHLGSSPRDYNISGQYIIDGGSNDTVSLKVVVWRDAGGVFEDQKTVTRTILALQGGRDVGYFALNNNITLNQNDYVKLQVANEGDTTNVTAELNSFFSVERR